MKIKNVIIFSLLLLPTYILAQDLTKDSTILKDEFVRKNIVGEWKDQNSTTIYRKNGTYSTTYDDKNTDHGKWTVEKNVLTFRGEIAPSLSAYYILSFSTSRMEFQLADIKSDNTVWIAYKVVQKKK